MVADLIRALLAALAAGVAPGYFWAVVLRPASGLAERLTYSAVLSMASVPVIAVLLARATGAGVTLWVALAAVGIVFGAGGLVYRLKGAAQGSTGPVLPSPDVVRDPRILLLIAGVFVLALATMLHLPAPGWLLLVTAAGLILAGALAARSAPATGPGGTSAASGGGARPGTGPAAAGPAGSTPAAAGPAGTGGPAAPGGPAGSARASARTLVVPTGSAAPAEPADVPGPAGSRMPSRPGVRDGALALVLALTAYRAYSGVVDHDWPFLRGSDQFSHAVMAEQMLTHGSYGSYLIYPPGFPALTAVICRFCGLTPLELFPVLAPALLVLCALGAYTLASGLWGWQYGIAAAALNGLVLTGAYAGFAEGRYPDLVAAYFLLVMMVAALTTLYQSPTLRSGALVAVVAASAVLYHSVATLYAAVMLALVAVIALPYLLLQHQRRVARVLLLTLGAAAVLAVCYAALTYNLTGLVTGHSSTSTAVSLTLGSQSAPAPRHLLTALGPALAWLGLFGAGAVAMSVRYLARPTQVLAAVTVLLWCVVMYVGSRTAADGFPQRFERDLGAPLSVVAAFGLVIVVRALLAQRAGARTALTRGRRGRRGGRGRGGGPGRPWPDGQRRAEPGGAYAPGRGGGPVAGAAQHRREHHLDAVHESRHHQPRSPGHGRLYRAAVLRRLPDRPPALAAAGRPAAPARLTAGPAAPNWLPGRRHPGPRRCPLCRALPVRAGCGPACLRHGPQPVPPGLPEPLGHHLRGHPSPMPGGLSPAPPDSSRLHVRFAAISMLILRAGSAVPPPGPAQPAPGRAARRLHPYPPAHGKGADLDQRRAGHARRGGAGLQVRPDPAWVPRVHHGHPQALGDQ